MFLRFALDWLPEVGHVTVLYDDVMCTLSVTSQYPAAGSISLLKVSDSAKQQVPDVAHLTVSHHFTCRLYL